MTRDLSKVIIPVAELTTKRNSWVRREICYFDLDTDDSSYYQKLTLDIDVSQVRKKYEKTDLKHLYIPLYWRKKGPIYAMNCCSAEGTNLRLLNRTFNEEFSEWLFWWRCERLIKDFELDGVSKALKNFVHAGIVSETTSRKSFGRRQNAKDNEQWKKLDEKDKEQWQKLMSNSILRILWKTVCECHIIVVRIPNNVDGSIIKFSETKEIELSRFSRLNPFSPVVKLHCEHFSAYRVKVLTPKDVRILACSGIESEQVKKLREAEGNDLGDYSERRRISMEVLGDNRWARRYSSATRDSTNWTFFLAPRRLDLLVPGLFATGGALCSCAFWLQHGTVMGDNDNFGGNIEVFSPGSSVEVEDDQGGGGDRGDG